MIGAIICPPIGPIQSLCLGLQTPFYSINWLENQFWVLLCRYRTEYIKPLKIFSGKVLIHRSRHDDAT